MRMNYIFNLSEGLTGFVVSTELFFLCLFVSPRRTVGMYPDSLRFLCFSGVILVPHVIGELHIHSSS